MWHFGARDKNQRPDKSHLQGRELILCGRNAPLPVKDQWQAARRAGWQAAGTNEGTLLKCIPIKRTEISLVEECVFSVVKYEVKAKNL